MNRLTYLKGVATLTLDAGKCTGCGMCLEVCPHAVFKMNDRHVEIRDRDMCMECGACSRNCPAAALFVQTGVGCAAAVMNEMLGRTGQPCCGPVDPEDAAAGKGNSCCCG